MVTDKSAHETKGRVDLQTAVNADFGAMLGEPVEPLGDKGAVFIPTTLEKTPGMLARQEAATKELHVDANALDSGSYIAPLDPLDVLEFCRPGVQHGVYKNLRLGKYDTHARLDLHRHTVEQARHALWRFAEECRDRAVRCALVTHGKGEGRKHPAVLKSCVNHWLRQLPYVLAFHSAQKHHGGLGATYLLIKKSADARRATGEKIEQAKRHRG